MTVPKTFWFKAEVPFSEIFETFLKKFPSTTCDNYEILVRVSDCIQEFSGLTFEVSVVVVGIIRGRESPGKEMNVELIVTNTCLILVSPYSAKKASRFERGLYFPFSVREHFDDNELLSFTKGVTHRTKKF